MVKQVLKTHNTMTFVQLNVGWPSRRIQFTAARLFGEDWLHFSYDKTIISLTIHYGLVGCDVLPAVATIAQGFTTMRCVHMNDVLEPIKSPNERKNAIIVAAVSR